MPSPSAVGVGSLLPLPEVTGHRPSQLGPRVGDQAPLQLRTTTVPPQPSTASVQRLRPSARGKPGRYDADAALYECARTRHRRLGDTSVCASSGAVGALLALGASPRLRRDAGQLDVHCREPAAVCLSTTSPVEGPRRVVGMCSLGPSGLSRSSGMRISLLQAVCRSVRPGQGVVRSEQGGASRGAAAGVEVTDIASPTCRQRVSRVSGEQPTHVVADQPFRRAAAQRPPTGHAAGTCDTTVLDSGADPAGRNDRCPRHTRCGPPSV